MSGPEAGEAEEPEEAGARGRLKVGVLGEEEPDEHRVALVPETVGRLEPLGVEVLVEASAGTGACFSDEAYAKVGARVVDETTLLGEVDVLVCLATPSPARRRRLRSGQVLVGLLQPLVAPGVAAELASAGVTAVSLDLLPRRLSRAQAMDALTSQANVAGYKAALVAANAFGRFFPMLVTAAGTVKPADVLVLGAGVAGLQAMGTARRLGAMVTGYDVRPETKGEIESVGARFLALERVASAAGEGGYARALTPEEQAAQQEELNAHVARFDVVITTAQVPGRRPPLLVTGEAVKQMRAGSVVVDLAAGPLGGNVEGTVPGATTRTGNGVSLIGAANLASEVATAASTAYANNLTALLRSLVHEGVLAFDLDDEVHAGVLVARGGEVVHPAVRALLATASAEEAST